MKMAMNTPTRFDNNPSAFERAEYTEDVKKMLLNYLKSFEISAVAGYVDDCVTGESTQITDVGYHDGEFMWSTQGIYHFEKYNLAVKKEFIDHVKKQRLLVTAV